MKKNKKGQRKIPIFKRLTKKTMGILSVTILALSVSAVVWYGIARANESDSNDSESSTVRSLQNGSFEEGQISDRSFTDASLIDGWNTTATDNQIELFKQNTNYISGVTLKPTAGTYAAELNANEESTLYQNVNTTPSSIYEWGLDHGARNTRDTMALVIGPKQSVNPSKPNKNGRDQLMQMIDWLNIPPIESKTEEPQKYIVYSKKFADNGAFENNAGNNAFSKTPSKIYTEKWEIWVMADDKATSGENPWGHYGANAEGSAGSKDDDENTKLDLDKYYLYKVPDGQNETLFGFVSVATLYGGKTVGNFLDNINFQLYHPLSGSTTTHGSAIIGASDGSTDSEGASKGHKVTVDQNIATYVTDGQPLKIQAIVKKADRLQSSFVGVYYRKQNAKGQNETVFLKRAGNEINATENPTDEQKKNKWIVSENDAGDQIYTYYLENVTTAVDLQFIFIKSPTVTYDSNGGKPYVVERQYNTDESTNVYSFKPASTSDTSELTFIPPYTSKAAEGQTKDWKFIEWQLTGDQVDGIPEDVDLVEADKVGYKRLPAEHTIVCNYSMSGATGDNAAQYFKIFPGKVGKNDFTEKINRDSTNAVSGVQWTKNANDDKQHRSYANVHRGLTMVAQWRWNQMFIPQFKSSGSEYQDSNTGGTITISDVESDTDNYTENYNNKGGKSYYASTNENISVTAKPNEGFIFEGWYDEEDNLLTTNETYSYTETAESVNTYYAKFSGGITQTYIRQVKNGDNWENITDDRIGTLGRYTYTDAIGKFVSSTASAENGYKFLGWYDKDGNKVRSEMLTNDGTTLQYNTTEEATYYARFAKIYTINFKSQTKQNESFVDDGKGGSVSVSSAEGIEGESVTSKAIPNEGYRFIGWYDKDNTLLSDNSTYTTQTGTNTDQQIYYARFEIYYNPQVDSKVYLSFIAESKKIQIPADFSTRDAGTEKNSDKYGLDNKYGNTIATGFKYSVGNATDISTVQITVEIPEGSYVKTGSNSNFSSSGESILKDSSDVANNKGEIIKIKNSITKTYHWDATGIKANEQYGFIIDNLYAPKAKATITVNGTKGTPVTDENGVVNANATEYKGKSHYSK